MTTAADNGSNVIITTGRAYNDDIDHFGSYKEYAGSSVNKKSLALNHIDSV